MVSNTINEKCGQNVIAVNFGLLIDRILSLLFILLLLFASPRLLMMIAIALNHIVLKRLLLLLLHQLHLQIFVENIFYELLEDLHQMLFEQ